MLATGVTLPVIPDSGYGAVIFDQTSSITTDTLRYTLTRTHTLTQTHPFTETHADVEIFTDR